MPIHKVFGRASGGGTKHQRIRNMMLLGNVVWPALFLADRLYSWWAIALGLVIEFYFVRWLTKLVARRAIAADLIMNAASALVGIFLLPAAGLWWEFYPGGILYSKFGIGTFNPGTWTVAFLFAVLVNAVLESLVLKYAFRQQVGRRVFGWLCVANGLSVAVAFCSVMIFRPYR